MPFDRTNTWNNLWPPDAIWICDKRHLPLRLMALHLSLGWYERTCDFVNASRTTEARESRKKWNKIDYMRALWTGWIPFVTFHEATSVQTILALIKCLDKLQCSKKEYLEKCSVHSLMSTINRILTVEISWYGGNQINNHTNANTHSHTQTHVANIFGSYHNAQNTPVHR